MYPVEIEIKDTTESNISATYLVLLLSMGREIKIHTSIYDKHDDFNFQAFRSWSSSVYGVLVSQLIVTPGIAPHMDVLFWGQRDLPISFSKMDTRYVKERLILSFEES